MNLYSVNYKHNDKTCCFERVYELVKRNCVSDTSKFSFDEAFPGIYTFGKSKKDANNYKVVAKTKDGTVYISH
jgi:hypothetical protein